MPRRFLRGGETKNGLRPLIRASVSALAVVLVAACSRSATVAPTAATSQTGNPRIIIDTDLSLWWDDATAVGMANVLQQRGQIRVLGIMSDVRNPIAVAAIDAIDTAYGHPNIPLGAVADSSADTAAHGYTDTLVESSPRHPVECSGLDAR